MNVNHLEEELNAAFDKWFSELVDRALLDPEKLVQRTARNAFKRWFLQWLDFYEENPSYYKAIMKKK